MADFDPILESHRYVFGETDSFYGVWDTQGEGGLLEQFPLSQEGFELAEARFRELNRRDRRERGVLHKVLWGAMFVGVVLWIATGLVALWEQFVDATPDSANFFLLSYSLGELGLRMAAGGLLALAGLALVHWRARADAVPIETSPRVVEPAAWRLVARWVLIAAVAIWVTSSFVTRLLNQSPFLSFDYSPDTAIVVAYMVEVLSFRIWVATFALLAVDWGGRVLLRHAGSAATPE